MDDIVHGLLEEEYRRSRDMLQGLLTKEASLPRGALNVRRKVVHGTPYLYHYLVRRDGRKVVNRHVAEREVPALRQQIAERRRNRQEIRVCKQRLACLERLLR